jgi:beta-xylosidase
MYYVSTFAQPTGRTHIYKTKDIAKGPWVEHTFAPSFHDHTLFFDDDGKTYLIYGAGKLKLVELEDDLSGVKKGTEEKVIIENAALPAGNNIGLPAEGSQLFKIKGKYYLFNITWPRNGMRTVVVHRADKITGPYEGKMVLQDKGWHKADSLHTRREMVCLPVPGLWLCRAYSFPRSREMGRRLACAGRKWQGSRIPQSACQ